MDKITISEINSGLASKYKAFLTIGQLKDEENFRITPADDLLLYFPTNDRKDSFTLGAYVNDELAGIVSFVRDGDNREKLRHKGTLIRMYVAEQFRGKGIAKQLLETLLKRVKKLEDIEQVNLTVMAHNKTAKALYEKFGFKTFGSEEHAVKWKGKYFTEDQMVLKFKEDIENNKQ